MLCCTVSFTSILCCDYVGMGMVIEFNRRNISCAGLGLMRNGVVSASMVSGIRHGTAVLHFSHDGRLPYKVSTGTKWENASLLSLCSLLLPTSLSQPQLLC